MNGSIPIGPGQLASAYIFLIMLLVLAWTLKLGRTREFIVASLRMTLQLVLAGYLLELVFGQRHPLVSLGLVLLMQMFAVITVFGRFKSRPVNRRLKKIIALALFTGTSLPLVYFMVVVLNLQPWFEPRYLIPIAGMTIGNSMTGISLGVERLLEGARGSRALIEEALMLGAAPGMALSEVTNTAFNAAIIPTINSMLGMGVVFLPGMMTGQILAGASPLIAIKYQAAIMMAILGSTSMAVYLLVRLAAQALFNERSQLRDDI